MKDALRSALERALKIIDNPHYHDSCGSRPADHPAVDELREALAASDPAAREVAAMTQWQPTEQQINAAHDAWEEMASQWRLRRVSNPMGDGDMWLLENVGSPSFEPLRDVGSEIAYHRFDGLNAEQRARFLFRDKCLKAVLRAVLPLPPTEGKE